MNDHYLMFTLKMRQFLTALKTSISILPYRKADYIWKKIFVKVKSSIKKMRPIDLSEDKKLFKLFQISEVFKQNQKIDTQ